MTAEFAKNIDKPEVHFRVDIPHLKLSNSCTRKNVYSLNTKV
jgi:hypothetical protein